MSVAHLTTELVWIRSLLTELNVLIPKKSLIWCDSSTAIVVAGNLVLHSKFKHVEMDLFFVRKKVADGVLQVGHVSASDQIANVLTKPLSVGAFTKFREQLCVCDLSQEVVTDDKS